MTGFLAVDRRAVRAYRVELNSFSNPRTTQTPTPAGPMRRVTERALRMAVSVRVRSLPELVQCVVTNGLQSEVADRADISRTRLNQLVKGKRANVSLELAARLEDALDVPRGSLFAFTDITLAAPYARRCPERAA